MPLSPKTSYIPLAEALRPHHVSEVIGQSHLLGEGKPLRLVIESGHIHSMILWGPPGVGKTTLAHVLANAIQGEFISLSAVFAGVKDIRAAMEKAELSRAAGYHTILFVDEIHRFNKSQQDALLPYVESGLVTLIGATTENPSFEINSALLSRTHVYILKSLETDELRHLFNRAQQQAFPTLQFEENAIQTLLNMADGDARRLLNTLESLRSAAEALKPERIETSFLEQALSSNIRRFDKQGDSFYDQISALHKSVRGSNPDAALYWLCRMLDGGADPHYLARRLIRMAWEDIGLADPRASEIALHAAQSYERLGSPEGELALAQATLYLAIAAKSNAGYVAYNQAKAFIKNTTSHSVPNHLKNAPTQLMKTIGYGHTYRYAHDEPHAYAAGESYFPDAMKPQNWYEPVSRGLEIKIAEKLAFLKNLDTEALQKHNKKK
ncbi:MAG: replication-associated recombination protein A [Pseudomonadota bacterium]